MKKGCCRICGQELFPEVILGLKAMPAAAQELPTLETLSKDRRVDLVLRQCSCCGVVQLTNKPVPYYRDVIRAVGCSAEMRTFRLRQFRKWIKDYELGQGRILELGCGGGEYLEIMREAGGNAYGIEHGHEGFKQCLSKNLPVENMFFEHGDEMSENGPYNGFFILNWLEHIPNFRQFLRALRKNLADHAAGLVEVPNFSMILNNGLVTEITSEHLYYFTQETFANALDSSGFDVLSCTPIWHDYILSAEVRKKTPVDNSLFLERKTSIARDIMAFVEMHGKVAIWGAGHQALAVMAIAGLKSKIAYVIDSSPLKQGRFTYATHIPIKAPETLKSNPVDAVLVLCAGYSDEVAQILRSSYPSVKHIAILREWCLEKLR